MDGQSWQEVPDYTSISASENNDTTPMDTLSIASTAIPSRGRETFQDNPQARSIFAAQALEIQPVNQRIENRHLMIRTREEPHLYLGLYYGDLKLSLRPEPGSDWYCERKGGWYGFCNTISGTYLGHGAANTAFAGTICAAQRFLSPSGYFTVDRNATGGCILHIFSPNTNDLLQVSVSEDKQFLLPRNRGGMAWEFVGST